MFGLRLRLRVLLEYTAIYGAKFVKKRIIVALDFDTPSKALNFLDHLDPDLCRVKIGKELFTAGGPDLVSSVVNKNFDVFLDLKFHDIPNTVAGAVRVASELGVWMLNVHIAGGSSMMRAAKEALSRSRDQPPILIGVTVLTSLSREDLFEVGVNNDLAEHVMNLASLAHKSGLDGVVCSADEAKLLRASLSKDFKLITPGIRRAQDSTGDQKRVVSRSEAIQNGSDFLVVGRPITRAVSPRDALVEFNSEIEIL